VVSTAGAEEEAKKPNPKPQEPKSIIPAKATGEPEVKAEQERQLVPLPAVTFEPIPKVGSTPIMKGSSTPAKKKQTTEAPAIPPKEAPPAPVVEEVPPPAKPKYLSLGGLRIPLEELNSLPEETKALVKSEEFTSFAKVVSRSKNEGEFKVENLEEFPFPASKTDINNMFARNVGKKTKLSGLLSSYAHYKVITDSLDKMEAPPSWPALEWSLKLRPKDMSKASGVQGIYSAPGLETYDKTQYDDFEIYVFFTYKPEERYVLFQKAKSLIRLAKGEENKTKFITEMDRLMKEAKKAELDSKKEEGKPVKAPSTKSNPPKVEKESATSTDAETKGKPPGGTPPVSSGVAAPAPTTKANMPKASNPKNKRDKKDFGSALTKNIGKSTLRTNTGTVDIFKGAFAGFSLMTDAEVSSRVYDEKSIEPLFRICMFNLIGRDTMVISFEDSSTTVSGDTGRSYREQYNAVTQLEEFMKKGVKDAKKLSSLQARANKARAKFTNLYGRDLETAKYLTAICGSTGIEAARAVYEKMLATKFFATNEAKPSTNVYWVLLGKNERLAALSTLLASINTALETYKTGMAITADAKEKAKLRSTLYSNLRSNSTFPTLETFLTDTDYILNSNPAMAKGILTDASFLASCKIIKECGKTLFTGWEKIMAGRASIRAIQFSFILVRQATFDAVTISKTDLLDSIASDLPAALSNEFRVKKTK